MTDVDISRLKTEIYGSTLGSDLTSFLMMGSSVVVTVWKIRSIRCSGFSFFTLTLAYERSDWIQKDLA